MKDFSPCFVLPSGDIIALDVRSESQELIDTYWPESDWGDDGDYDSTSSDEKKLHHRQMRQKSQLNRTPKDRKKNEYVNHVVRPADQGERGERSISGITASGTSLMTHYVPFA